MRLIEKVICIFIAIVFITFLTRHGLIDFSGLDFVADKTKEAVNSEEGQELINEVKDISKDTVQTIIGETKERVENWKDSSENETSDKSILTEAELIRVVDGDTIIVSINDEETRVRLIGIDTPESVNPDETKNTSFGKLASDYTKSLLSDTEAVWLQYDEETTDKYGRQLAYVWIKEVTDLSSTQNVANYMVNGILISDGYAVDKMYAPNVTYADVFAEIREAAQNDRRGLWDMDGIEEIWGGT